MSLDYFPHWSFAPWEVARWPNFSPRELACRGTGAYAHDPASFDGLQAVRDRLGAPLRITSGHRSPLHNARVGGAPRSAHLAFAADVALDGHDRRALLRAARASGFVGFGAYETFLHLDRRRARVWFGSDKARASWMSCWD